MAVEPVTRNAASQISGAIQKAAQSTGISFHYLLTTAKIESNLNPSAQASTSSAKGLYQFIDQTWLGTMKQEGASLGLGQYAKAITQNSDGRYEVADPAMRAEILKLRSDPQTSALMAGAFSRANAFQLIGAVGRPPSEGELYIAHFLGPDGAGKLINAVDRRPSANAAAMFPSAAGANRSIFYNRDGSAKTVGEVYNRLTAHFDDARSVMVAVNRPASAPAVVPSAPAAATGTPTVVASGPAVAAGDPAANNFLAAIPVASAPASAPLQVAAMTAPDTAGITQAYAAARDTRASSLDTRPLFRAMFTDTPRAGVNQTVAGLWSPSDATSSDGETSALSAPGLPVRTLDLFTDSATNVRGIFHRKA